MRRCQGSLAGILATTTRLPSLPGHGNAFALQHAELEHPVTPRLETGPLRIQLSADSFGLLDAIWLDLDGDGRISDAERMTDDRTTGIRAGRC